jgi:subtilisin family serine protease
MTRTIRVHRATFTALVALALALAPRTFAAPLATTLPTPLRSTWTDKITVGLLAEATRTNEPLDCIVVFRAPAPPPGSSEAAGRRDLGWIARTSDRIESTYAPAGVRVIGRYSHLPMVHIALPPAFLPALGDDSEVLAIVPNRHVRALRTQGKQLMRVPDVHALGFKGKGVGIAILDTGVDYTHAELAPAGTKTIKLYDAIDKDDDPKDEQGHGTSVAGIAGGSGNGVAPEATIVAVRVLDRKGEGSDDQIIDGINAVLASIAGGNPHNIKVANFSLGGYDDDDWPPKSGTCDSIAGSYATAFGSLVDAGVLVVVAAGNGGCTKGVAWPACISHAMAVGAVYDDSVGPQTFTDLECSGFGCFDFFSDEDEVACYSDSGDKLSVWAPSHCAKTPAKGGGNEDCFGGTSASAPYVAGVGALLSQAIPGRTVSSLRTALEETGRKIKDGRNSVTRRRVNASEALTRLRTGCSAPATPTGLASTTPSLCGNDSATLGWAATTGASTYTVQVADNPSYEGSSVFDATITATSFTLTQSRLTPATLYCRVRANSACGLASDWSTAVQVSYEPRCGGATYGHTYYVSGIARTPGIAPAYWYSDLAILNPGSTAVDVRISYFGTSTPLAYTTTLASHQQVIWRDVLSSLFAIASPDVGVVVVESTGALAAQARTYSLVSASGAVHSLGQSYDALQTTDALATGAVGYLPNLRSDGAFRTNVELVNVGITSAEVEVRFFGNQGVALGQPLLRNVPPSRRVAVTAALPAGQDGAYAEVRVTSQDGRVLVFASVVDGSSTDPTTVPLSVL